MSYKKEKLVELKNVTLTFNKGKPNQIKALNNINLDIYKGEIFGLVGESGSGKTTLGMSLLGLQNIDKGKIKFAGNSISQLREKELFRFRKLAQMIFQNPRASLDGRMKIKDIVTEGLVAHKKNISSRERDVQAKALLQLVGLSEDYLYRYPHELSGGQCQRVGIARALAVEPAFVVADEPISALDMSIRSQIVHLLKKLQLNNGLTYLFIAHDLSIVSQFSDRIGVMHQGKIVEVGPSQVICRRPIHPYTQNLLSAVPIPDPEIEKNRTYKAYTAKAIECNTKEQRLREIEPDHFALLTEKEAKNL
ncbi:ATP-binding cassette domain-containing protein [Streptococcus macacae]|uniref:ABC transporter, ATP-binding protein n=1 Tax=Streptococcus macacae NCTC 11558 TaxID=764298 RepID=G5JW96_9STRE|nr:ATP-binding cassette domain-containing protein [Streptococcus macacae]EHJ52293.1 ABC transporter, ATP-binding protein [Streptococcus macacae NCTC 11558]SUN77751.1 oligopeptidepermease [Streptococcus macacae NCTC 11558]